MSVLRSDGVVEFPKPRAEVFDAILRALPECNMKLKASDAATGHIEAVTSMSMASWGEKIKIDLADAGEGATEARITSGNRAQLITWGRNKKNLEKIVERTNAQLGA
ncbi:MAG TPA: hypothetical protein VIG64_05915 [Actinomycetota bacterium]|jgi:hypothetical protein